MSESSQLTTNDKNDKLDAQMLGAVRVANRETPTDAPRLCARRAANDGAAAAQSRSARSTLHWPGTLRNEPRGCPRARKPVSREQVLRPEHRGPRRAFSAPWCDHPWADRGQDP